MSQFKEKIMAFSKKRIGVLSLVIGLMFVGLGAQNFREVNPKHPVFSALEVGQFINVQWEQTGCVISDWGNIKKVEAIGRDYLVYSETGMTYYLYINQVKLVVVRPGGRIIDPLNKSDLDTPDDFYEPSGTPPSGGTSKKPADEKVPQKIEPVTPEEEQNPFG